MPEVGQSLWNEIYGAMTEAGVLKKTDVRTLEAHCRAWALYKRADTEMNEGSMVQVAESGYTAPTAWLTIRSKAFQEFSKTGAELGLTPASRTRIRADDGAKPEPMIPTRQREA
jgi:P27 family predicted phage terminase small subunit